MVDLVAVAGLSWATLIAGVQLARAWSDRRRALVRLDSLTG